MDIGMLWYDDDTKRPLAEKVERAVNFYRAKYGRVPNVGFVHPKMMPPGAIGDVLVAGVMLRGKRTIIRNHFWLGVEEVKVKA